VWPHTGARLYLLEPLMLLVQELLFQQVPKTYIQIKSVPYFLDYRPLWTIGRSDLFIDVILKKK
jgi:hypothetical protein